MACKKIDTTNPIFMKISNVQDYEDSDISETKSWASRSNFEMELQYQEHHDFSTLNKTKSEYQFEFSS